MSKAIRFVPSTSRLTMKTLSNSTTKINQSEKSTISNNTSSMMSKDKKSMIKSSIKTNIKINFKLTSVKLRVSNSTMRSKQSNKNNIIRNTKANGGTSNMKNMNKPRLKL